MSELNEEMPEKSSPNASIKVETLNDDIKQLVNKINALVDVEFAIKMAQKKLDYSTTYKNKCIVAIDAAKSNCEKAIKVYSDLKMEAEGTPKEQFRKLYSQLSSKNADSNGSPVPIDEWNLGLDCKYTSYTNPVYVEPTPSRFSRSIFSAKHHYTHGRSHSTIRGALSHHSYLSSVYEDMLNKSELLNTSLRLGEDCIQKNLDKIEESLKSLQSLEKNYQNEYNEYIAAVKGKLKEFKKFHEAMGEDYTGNQHWWSTLSFRSHKPSIKTLKGLTHPEDLTSFDTPPPSISTSTAQVEPDEPARLKSMPDPELKVKFAMDEAPQNTDKVPFKSRFCMYCNQKTEYRQINPCEWKCMGCESRKLENSPSEISQNLEINAKDPIFNIDGFSNSIRSHALKSSGDADSNREGPLLLKINDPLNLIDDNRKPIYVGPKEGKTVRPNEMNSLERMFARNT